MNIQIRNVQIQATSKALEEYLRPYLAVFDIFTFDCNKIKNKPVAILTIPDLGKAETFIQLYGENEGGGKRAKNRIDYFHKLIYFHRGHDSPDEAQLRCLQLEEKQYLEKVKKKQAKLNQRAMYDLGGQKTFGFSWLVCGNWDYNGYHAGVKPYFADDRTGVIKFGNTSLSLLLTDPSSGEDNCRIDIPFWTIDHIVTGDYTDPRVTLSLKIAPKFYQIPRGSSLVDQMNNLGIGPSQRRPKRIRICSLNRIHETMVGSCFVYQIYLSYHPEIATLFQMLSRNKGMPSTIPHRLVTMPAGASYEAELSAFKETLLAGRKHGHFPFAIKFQLERLVRNAYLTPIKVLELLPVVDLLYRNRRDSSEVNAMRTVTAIRSLAKQINYPGPQEDANNFRASALGKLLRESASQFSEEGSIYEHNKRHEHIVLVHKATVTPAGIYLEGPEPEVTNRVLRKHSKHIEYFIRVNFADEDGESVRFDPNATLENVYHGRFKAVLEGGITIAGFKFEFVGYSHSSLRSQTCWFMAPFVQQGSLINAQELIQGLGDFSEIKSPAKCAARIGQAFSDTNGKITINTDQSLGAVLDVERNGRTFSDGVGTISKPLLKRVWKEYSMSHKLNPTCLQIRFGGAKGMVSLDSRLKGELFVLRPSMMKFNTKDTKDIEICNSNTRPLPMYLNRQFIKILEDLGVKPQVFLNLQAAAVDKLRRITTSPVNAANYLEAAHIGRAARVSPLIKMLEDIGLLFNNDNFLEHVVEIAALAALRDLKHRSRIPVEQGFTLYGIMDESGTLQEGEIYCVTEDPVKGGRRVLVRDQVIVTRAPALHPGDVQIARAVDVPRTSMLNHLNNCVVFSQHGKRDLPSMLSGGDLDGDLYNVIYDNRLLPMETRDAADYPRLAPVDIGRRVTRKDMTDFLITFMETDRLGQISTIHLQLADIRPEGTLHPDCIKLAGMASTAVDFSKTGIPVNMSECPRYNSLIRPDFMAPGPRVMIEEKGAVIRDDDEDDGEDEISALDPEFKRRRYYESDKVLGHLYRAIDEKYFFEEMHRRSNAVKDAEYGSVMDQVWEYVQEYTRIIQWQHHLDLAKDIRDTYESNLVDVMTDYSSHPRYPLREVEVFCGTIIGKTGSQSKHMRESAMEMKDRFERDVTFTIERITQGDDGDKTEALARSIACLYVGGHIRKPRYKRMGDLESFRYVAAVVCLKEVQKFQHPYGPLDRRF